MEKHVSGLLFAFAAIALMLAGLSGVVGYNVGHESNVVETEIVYQNVSVDKIVEVPLPSQLDKAVEEFMKAVEDEEDEAGNDVDVLGSYDFDEVEISKVYDEYTVEYDDDKITVNFSIKLRFDEEGEASEKETFDVEVVFEEGEDTEVTVD